MSINQKALVISIATYFIMVLLMFISTFFYFRTFLLAWFICLLAAVLISGISAICIIVFAKKASKEDLPEEASQEVVVDTTEPISETKNVQEPEKVEETKDEHETDEENILAKAEKQIITDLESIVNETKKDYDVLEKKDNTTEVNTILNNTSSEYDTNEEEKKTKRVYTSYNTLEDLRSRAKERRSKEDVVVGWRILNPFGTQRECAKDLSLSMKTVRKWWDSYQN